MELFELTPPFDRSRFARARLLRPTESYTAAFVGWPSWSAVDLGDDSAAVERFGHRSLRDSSVMVGNYYGKSEF